MQHGQVVPAAVEAIVLPAAANATVEAVSNRFRGQSKEVETIEDKFTYAQKMNKSGDDQS